MVKVVVSSLSVLAVAVSLVHAGSIPSQYRRSTEYGSSPPKALYFMTDIQSNSIVALPIGSDGRVGKGSITSTGGKGGSNVDPKTGKPATMDTLSSQGSVQVVDKYLFAVNPGSNTLSMFEIDQHDPTKLKLLSEPVNTLGEFPVTVAVSRRDHLVCVGSTGAKAGVACATYSNNGVGSMDFLRPYALNQSTPPSGPLNTISHTFFDEGLSLLLTTVKGDGTAKNSGYISAFRVQGGKVGRDDTHSSPAGTAVMFGSAPIEGTNNVLVSDVSVGAAIVSIDGSGRATTKALAKVPGQQANCWAVVSRVTGTGFLVDPGVNRIAEVDLASGAIVKVYDVTGAAGVLDAYVAGQFLYTLAVGNATVKPAVVVHDLGRGRGKVSQVQAFPVEGVPSTVQGMAVFTGTGY